MLVPLESSSDSEEGLRPGEVRVLVPLNSSSDTDRGPGDTVNGQVGSGTLVQLDDSDGSGADNDERSVVGTVEATRQERGLRVWVEQGQDLLPKDFKDIKCIKAAIPRGPQGLLCIKDPTLDTMMRCIIMIVSIVI